MFLTKFKYFCIVVPKRNTDRKLFEPLAKRHQENDQQKLQKIYEGLKNTNPSSCLFSMFDKEDAKTESGRIEIDTFAADVPEEIIIQATTSTANDTAKVNLICSLASTAKSAEDLLSRLPVLTESEVHEIENETLGQSSNPTWISQRKGRLTASKFYSVFTRIKTVLNDTSKEHDLQPLIKTIMGYQPVKHGGPALEHGIKYEPVAREKYIDTITSHHNSFSNRECGLFVDAHKPYIACTPDLLVECKCCGAGLAEFKCPYSISGEAPSAANLKYLVVVDGTTQLKENHSYYAQVQGQLAITKRKYCDFFVYTQAGHFLQRIYFDEDYWEKILQNLDFFFHNYLAQELVASNVTN